MKSNGAYGMVAEFTSAASVLHAAEKVRDAGFRKWDVFTPFPVHGMDKAMGLKNSKVGWFALCGGGGGVRGRDVHDLFHNRAGLSDGDRRQADVQSLLGLSAFVRTHHP